MSEVIVAFWTGTGNTAEMAEYVAEGIKEGGAEAKVVSVDDISAAAVSYTHLMKFAGTDSCIR